MLRTVFAMAVAGLVFAAVSGTAQAAPIAPLAVGVTLSDVSQFHGAGVGEIAGGACTAVGVGETAGVACVAGDFSFLT